MPRVQCYYNLHKKVFSIRDKKTRKVIGHTNHIALENCTFHVSQAGRERVLREKRKNVHAYIEGDIVEYDAFLPPYWMVAQESVPVTYNPYRVETFCQAFETGQPLSDKPVRSARGAVLCIYIKPSMRVFQPSA